MSARPIEEQTGLAATFEMRLKLSGERDPDLLSQDVSHMRREIIPAQCADALVGKVSAGTLDSHREPGTFKCQISRDLLAHFRRVNGFVRILRERAEPDPTPGTAATHSWDGATRRAACPSTLPGRSSRRVLV